MESGQVLTNAPEHAVIQVELPLKVPLQTAYPRLFTVLAAVSIEYATYCLFPISTAQGTAILLLCVLVLALSRWQILAATVPKRVFILAISLLPVLWPGASPVVQLLGFGPILAALASNIASIDSGSARRLLVATGLMVVLLLIEQTGLLWQELSNLSWFVSYQLSKIGGAGVRLGPAPLGITWYIFPLCLWLAQFRIKRSAIPVQATLLLACLICGAVSLITSNLLIVASATILIALFGNWSTGTSQRPSGLQKVVWVAVYCCTALGLVFSALGYQARPSSPTVVGILDGGLKTLALPSRTHIADPNNACFGGLRLLLPYYGWKTRTLPVAFGGKQVDSLGVLCVINPQVALTTEQQQSVENYVRRGGALLVLGDHTDIAGTRGPLNRLLSFTHIRFNYDSAIPVDTGWRWKTCLRGALHPVFWQRQSDTISISVGASLSCRAPARVLVVGDRCFSDNGRPWFGVSHLGNEKYDPGERMGGLPLVAEERIGDGVVQVWGDTSGFQDTPLTQSHTMVASVFEQLYTGRVYQIPGLLIGLLLLCVAIVSVFGLSQSPVCLYGALVAGSMLFYMPAHLIHARSAVSPRVQAPRLDGSHQPQYPRLEADCGQYRLHETFLRHGQVLLNTGNFESLPRSGADWWVISSPTRAYSRSEALRLRRYVEQGGRLLLVSGYSHRAGLLSVLRQFDLDIAPEPFGGAHNSRLTRMDWRKDVLGGKRGASPPTPSNIDATAYDAEMSFQESNPIVSKGSVSLVSCWGHDLAVSRSVGRGRVVLIADSRFCTDKNLGKHQINVANIRFILKCLEE